MALPPLSRIRFWASVVIVIAILLLGWCRARARGADPVNPPAGPVPPPTLPALPPPQAPAIPLPAIPAAESAQTPPPAPVLEPAPAPLPEPPPPAAVPPPAESAPAQPDPQERRRAAIREQLLKEGYRYGGKNPGPWPEHLLEEEIQRRLRQ